MKQLFITAIALVAMIGTGSCTKKNKHIKECTGAYSGRMEVIKDCTGSYLRFNNVDYLVCNANLLASYNSGSWVSIGFKRITDCSTPQYLGICNMAHQHDGMVEITCISKSSQKINPAD